MEQQVQEIISKYRREKKLESGKKVSIQILPMTHGLGVAKELLKVIAPAIGGSIDGIRHDPLVHGAPTSFSDLALTLCHQVDNLKIVDLINVLLQDLHIEGEPVDLDDYFRANYAELIEIVEFSLRENFSTFFTGKGIKARLMKAVQTLMAGTLTESE